MLIHIILLKEKVIYNSLVVKRPIKTTISVERYSTFSWVYYDTKQEAGGPVYLIKYP